MSDSSCSHQIREIQCRNNFGKQKNTKKFSGFQQQRAASYASLSVQPKHSGFHPESADPTDRRGARGVSHRPFFSNLKSCVIPPDLSTRAKVPGCQEETEGPEATSLEGAELAYRQDLQSLTLSPSLQAFVCELQPCGGLGHLAAFWAPWATVKAR